MARSLTAFIGLGGNVGDVFANMCSALQTLDKQAEISVTAISNVYKTPPWGIKDQDWFLNACAKVETSLSAQDLLAECLKAEQGLNRIRNQRWGPRTIDLDVLLYGEEVVEADNLQIPHPRMHERGFVLLPLADIAPDLSLHGKTVQQWTDQLEIGDIQKTELKITL